MKRKLRPIIYLFAFCLCAIGGFTSLHAQSSNAPILSLAPGASPTLTVSGTAGATYQVQSSAQLLASNQWTALTNILLGNSPYLLQDPTAASNAIRFYRALLVSLPSDIFNGYAPAQLMPGEVFQFTINSPGAQVQTLIVLSATNGLLVTPANPLGGPGYSSVGIQFMPSNSLTAGLNIVTGTTQLQTNTFSLVFTSTNSGVLSYASTPQYYYGTFTFGAPLAGQNPARSQFLNGEIWQMSFPNNGVDPTNLTMVVESATNAWWIGLLVVPAFNGIAAVSVQFNPDGPYAGTLTVIFPPGTPGGFPATNTYSVEFTAANSGLIQSASISIPSSGTFVRNTNLVGQTVAPSQLTPGEKYPITTVVNGTTTLQYLLVDKGTNDWWVTQGNPPVAGFSNCAPQYTQLGPLSGELSVVLPPGTLTPTPTTNTYLLVFTSANSGAIAGSPQTLYLGTFSRNTTLVGQMYSQPQLLPGENYQFTPSGPNPGGAASLLINSSTDAIWQVQGAGSLNGITDVPIQYSQVGSFGGQLTAVVPSGANPPLSTNAFLILFTGTNNGVYEATSAQPSPSGSYGGFLLNTNLIGQLLAPPQLVTGESYQFAQTNTAPSSSVTNTLILDSAADGLFIANIVFAGNPISSATVQYNNLGPVAASAIVVLPVSTTYPSGQTNSFILLYNSLTNGLFEMTNSSLSIPDLGTFSRSLP